MNACLLLSLPLLVAAAPPAGDGPDLDETRRPMRLADPREHLVGRLVADLEFTDVNGRAGRLSDTPGTIVIALRDESCPVSKRYGPRLAALEREYAGRGVTFVFINVGAPGDLDPVRTAIAQHGFGGRYAIDRDGRIARALRAGSTTEVFLLDSARTLRYRGAVDDQYGIGYNLDAPRTEHLRRALDAVLAGGEVDPAATTAPGCFLAFDPAAPAEPTIAPTYHDRISRIVQANCLACHREGGAGPFALDTYDRVKGRRGMIQYVLEEKLMPPWHADEMGGPWRNVAALPADDLAAMLAWFDAGAPEGDPRNAPLPRSFAPGWRMGEPDAVVRLPEDFEIPAEGALDYQYAYVKTDFGEDKWIAAMEFRPTAPQVVHHALIFVEEPRKEGESRDDFRGRWQGGLRGYFGGMVPGQGPTIYPEGVAKKLPAGAWLKFQMHYTPNGAFARDRTEVGFIFADGPPVHEMHHNSAMTTKFEIPAGASNYEVRADATFPVDAVLYSFAPHMHLRGKAFRYDLIYPDGRAETILNIPRYDFNWQTAYRLLEPLRIPKGARIECTAWFDNSTDNPANPDPTKRVEFGEQTWDEMMIGYFEWWREEEGIHHGDTEGTEGD